MKPASCSKNRKTRVAPHPHHRCWPFGPKELPGLAGRANERGDRQDRAQTDASYEGPHVDELEWVSPLGNDRPLQSAWSADERHDDARIATAQCLREGESGEDVSAGAPRRDHDRGRHLGYREDLARSRRDPLRIRPTDTRTPTAVRDTTRDEPPNETNGRGTPVIGRRPVT